MTRRRNLLLAAGAAIVAAVTAATAVVVTSSIPHGSVNAPGVSVAVSGLPDPALTPGSLNPDVTQATIGTTICVPGWTATIRPPASFTDALKKQQMANSYHRPGTAKDYEEDHLEPLEVGGHPRDPLNLWPEPRTGMWPASKKDQLENVLKKDVCNGTITLAVAQQAIRFDWTKAYVMYVGGHA